VPSGRVNRPGCALAEHTTQLSSAKATAKWCLTIVDKYLDPRSALNIYLFLGYIEAQYLHTPYDNTSSLICWSETSVRQTMPVPGITA
jgi:hypothetical protein